MTANLEVVITMGGLGSRFKEKGYTLPKYMISVKGKTLFEWSLISLEGFKEQVCQYIFIVLKVPGVSAEEFIKEKCLALNISNYKIIVLDKVTDGQATTAMLAEKFWKKENPLLIYNIDTYVEAGAMNSSQIKGDGFIPCFVAPGDHWSFVRVKENNEAVEIKEKERISDFCTLGAYYFKSCQLFKELYRDFYGKGLPCKEKYVAPIYNYLLEKGGKIYISIVPASKVHVLGTPEELKSFMYAK